MLYLKISFFLLFTALQTPDPLLQWTVSHPHHPQIRHPSRVAPDAPVNPLPEPSRPAASGPHPSLHSHHSGSLTQRPLVSRHTFHFHSTFTGSTFSSLHDSSHSTGPGQSDNPTTSSEPSSSRLFPTSSRITRVRWWGTGESVRLLWR